MKFETNKEKGNSGLVAAIGYYGMLGYTISIPLNDTQDYDLIVDNGKKLLKVQVKATAQRTPQGYSVVNLQSCGGTAGTMYKTVKDTDVDVLFVLTELQEMYEIPIEAITSARSLGLGPERQEYRVDNIDTFYFLKTSSQKSSIEYQQKCKICGKELGERNTTGMCLSCANAKNRKIQDRPEKEQLLKELQSTNFTAVGKKYGVSDNTIRKWCKYYDLPTHIKEIKEYQLN